MSIPEIEHGIPFPVRKPGTGIYQRKRRVREDSPARIWELMQVGDSMKFTQQKQAQLFVAHVIRLFGAGRCRMMRYGNGTVRVWRIA